MAPYGCLVALHLCVFVIPDPGLTGHWCGTLHHPISCGCGCCTLCLCVSDTGGAQCWRYCCFRNSGYYTADFCHGSEHSV